MPELHAFAVAPPVVPRATAHVFVPDLDRVQLDELDARHFAGSLRLRAGEKVTASDGHGRWRYCEVSGSRRHLELVPTGEVMVSAKPAPPVEVGLPLLKGSRLDWAVQKCTEVGADRIVLVGAARAVVRWRAEQSSVRVDRLRRIAREAAMQSRRAWLPEVTGVTDVAELVADEAVAARVAVAERDGAPPGLGRPFVLVGPEGGFDSAELPPSLPRVGLGPTILRSETAALAAAILLSSLRWV